jgi:eukaryotic-like serine/threonine-protein kinase
MTAVRPHLPLPPGARLEPGLAVIEHLSRTRRYDTYEVWSGKRACSCVAKLARPDRAGEERVRAALVREGELLAGLTHPHLVRAYEVLSGPVVVLETLGGQTLDHLIDTRPSGLEPDEVAWLGLHLASVLHYLHGRALLHLDVKPGNVVADAGRAKLLDLSLARPAGVHPPGIGTWCHCAPEQARGGRVGPSADVWGLGTVLYEAATRMPAFDDPHGAPSSVDAGVEEADEVGEWDGAGEGGVGDGATWDTGDQVAAGYPQLDGPALPVTTHRRLPPPLAAAIDACLRPEPAERPTPAQLAARLVPFAPGARRWDG